MKPLAILFITRKWPPAVGGMETYSAELHRRLADGHNVRLFALPGRADGRRPSLLALIAFGLTTAWRLLFERDRFDVAHGGDMAVWPLVWLARRRARQLVLSAHGTDVGLGTRRGLIARLYAAYLRLGARALANVSVLANSDATAGLTRRFGYGDLRVVRLAAEPTEAATSAAAGETYVAFVGRLITSKGCGWFIREVLPKLAPEIRLKVAGTVVDVTEGAALGNPRVDFLGPKFGAELAALRRNAIAVVVPNLVAGPESFEGFGLTAVEGAADGGVVIAARAHGVTDAVVEDVTGFLETPGDADAWASRIAAVQRWAPSERTAFIERAASAVRAQFSWERVTDETLEAYAAQSGARGNEQTRLEQSANRR